MIVRMYRWEIPRGRKEEFVKDWTELTRLSVAPGKMIYADLYFDGTEYVALTFWSSKDAWQVWLNEFAEHPSRTKWRDYRNSAGSELEVITQLGKSPKGVVA